MQGADTILGGFHNQLGGPVVPVNFQSELNLLKKSGGVMGIMIRSAAAAAVQPTVTHDHDSFVSRSLHQNRDRTDGMEIAIVDQLQNSPPAAFNSRPRRKLHLAKGVPAAILVCLLVIFEIMFFCMRLHSKAPGVGMQQRSLAEGSEKDQGDVEEELQAVLAECLERHDRIFVENQGTGLPPPWLGVRASKRMKLERTVQGIFSRAQQASAPSASTTVTASSESALVPFEEEERDQRPPESKLTKKGLTHLQKSSLSAPLSQVSYPAGTSAESAKPSRAEPSSELLSIAQEVMTRGPERGEEGPEEPSTSATSGGPGGQSGAATPLWSPREHPFTRLPSRAPGAVTRSFFPGGLYHGEFGCGLSSSSLLSLMRDLFKAEVLNSNELELLLRAAESLVYVATKRAVPAAATGTRPSHILKKLGWYFVVYEALVCAKEVLGPNMPLGAWWSAFTSLHPSDYDIRVRSRPGMKSYDLVTRHVQLVNRLSKALALYKQGIRPPKQVVYGLKRDLFCRKDSPSNAVGHYSHLFVRDHLQFLAENPDFPEEPEEDDG
ncbi:hypothetical protein Esti_001699 [Eimeria stiedai]